MSLLVTFSLVGLFLILMGFAVHIKKWYFLISGYNTMSEEQKANVDVESLGRLVGIYCYLNGVILIVMGLLHFAGYEKSLAPGLIFLGISTVYILVKSQKYDGNLYEDGKLKKGAWIKIILIGGIIVVTLLFVAVLMFFSAKPTKVIFEEEGVRIQGMYGELITWEEIEQVQLKEELPTIEARTNGSAVGPHLKGNFRTKELGSVKLFVNREKPPFIYLERGEEKPMILNLGDGEETERIYREILEKTK